MNGVEEAAKESDGAGEEQWGWSNGSGKVGDKSLVRAIDMTTFELDLLEEYDSRFKKLSLGEGGKETYVELNAFDEDEDEEVKEEEDEEEGEVGGVRVEREEEENATRIADIVDEFSGFSTSNEDDSSNYHGS
ncbi:uncharacterized protein HKW66_Vig0210870 [Vigna angularis]|uniref:Uncharacterized protein n=1 Tax=Phaseolus angularis TaxID=3914 RepID=A0A8T0JIF4_PHAAN|nr:uncharacterized protein HKW66_Vig0210870 [Vigna angularis]